VTQNLFGGLRRDAQIATRAVLQSNFGVEQPQVMKHLRDGGHRRFAPTARDALLDRNRRGHTPDEIDLRLAKRL
jgi:hypothetical protein